MTVEVLQAYTDTDALATAMTNGHGGERGLNLTKWEISIFGSFVNFNRGVSASDRALCRHCLPEALSPSRSVAIAGSSKRRGA